MRNLTIFTGNEGEKSTLLKPHHVAEEVFKLKAFSFSLIDSARTWLRNLKKYMQENFLKKYFPSSKATMIRKELVGIKQKREEPLFDYLERLRNLQDICHHLIIPQNLLIEYF